MGAALLLNRAALAVMLAQAAWAARTSKTLGRTKKPGVHLGRHTVEEHRPVVVEKKDQWERSERLMHSNDQLLQDIHQDVAGEDAFRRREDWPASSCDMVPDEPSLVWMGGLLFWSGLGCEAREYSTMLGSSIRNMYIRPFGDGISTVLTTLPQQNRKMLVRLLNNSKCATHNEKTVSVCHSTPGLWFGNSPFNMWANHEHGVEELEFPEGPVQCPEAEGGYNIGRAMFETDSVPTNWIPNLNRMDEVWVPAQFVADSFRNAGVTSKLVVIPEAVDTKHRFNPANVERPYDLGLKNSTYKFLSIFKWHWRKGVDQLIRSFCEEFTSNDDVALVIQTRGFGLDYRADLGYRLNDIVRDVDWITDHSQLPDIRIIDDWIPDDRLPSLYAAADSFVLPSRGEGWGLPQAEAMAMGLPAIITNWAGTSEFAKDEFILPVNYTVKPFENKDQMNGVYFGFDGTGHHFADPDKKSLRSQIRYAFEHVEEGKELGKRARQHMIENFSIEAVREKITQRLSELPVKVAF